MAFQGDLRNIGLATVFQNLQQNLQSGTLRLERKDKKRFVYLKEGRVAMYSPGEGVETPVGEFLMRNGKITGDELDAAAKKRRKGTRLGGVLERTGSVTPDDLNLAVRQFIEEELYDLFTWLDGKFEFEEGSPPEGLFDIEMRNASVSLDPNAIILEAARRVDEWERINRIVGSLGDIYVVRRERQPDLEAMRDDRIKRVAEFLDGRRDVSGVIRDSAMGRFTVCNTLSRLVGERIVRPVSADELRKLAEEAEIGDSIEEAVRLMRRALDLERNDTSLRTRLAGLLDRAGEKEEAASEYKLLANSFMDAGRTNDAVDALRKAIDLMPSDVTTRERLFQLLSDSGGKTVALETGMALASTYTTLGLNEKARASLQKLLALNPSDRAAVERRLIDSHLSLGDVKAAIEQIRKMAKRAMKARDFDEAGRFFDELLKLDSKDEEARKRVAEIQAGIVERLQERRRARIRAVVIIAVSLPLAVFFGREVASRPAETEMHLQVMRAGVDAARLLERAEALVAPRGSPEVGKAYEEAGEGFDVAVRAVKDFRKKWSWTLGSWSAGKELDEWQSLSASAWMEAADAYKAEIRYDDAHRIYKKLSRSQNVPPAAADEAHKKMKELVDGGLVSPPKGGEK
jgi:tetratricopeptide (TPR) repeat protein